MVLGGFRRTSIAASRSDTFVSILLIEVLIEILNCLECLLECPFAIAIPRVGEVELKTGNECSVKLFRIVSGSIEVEMRQAGQE